MCQEKTKKAIWQKFFWDDAKCALAALIVGPVSRPETIEDWVITFGVVSTVALLGYLFDGMEVKS